MIRVQILKKLKMDMDMDMVMVWIPMIFSKCSSKEEEWAVWVDLEARVAEVVVVVILTSNSISNEFELKGNQGNKFKLYLVNF
jgi:hypothetical protein